MILDVARDLAQQYGFWSFRVDDILRHAHISRATFYKYFRNREDVLFTLFDNRLEEIESEMRTAVAEVTGSYERLRAFMKLRIAGMMSLFISLNIRISETDSSPLIPRERIKRRNEKDLAIVREILADGKMRGDLVFDDLSMTARAVMGITREIGFAALFENKDTDTIRREIEAMLGALFFGISGGSSDTRISTRPG
ncbi:MAG: TetR/AcrR family transcriptional regulator [Candidatus Dadabacteria bacterium]|nr:TetR/AcrR family transcriptional regulator [Candidatus Dadabacteria bacterium]